MREIVIDPVNGNDAATGTTADPLRTLQAWASQAQSGDKVVVRAAPGRLVPGAKWHAEGCQVVADGDVTIIPAQGMSDGLRIDLTGVAVKADTPSLIQGFKITNCPHAGVFSIFCPLLTVADCVITDIGLWGIHIGSGNGLRVLRNQIARVSQQHGVYVCNSSDDFQVVDNFAAYCERMGVHVNGDLDTSTQIGMANPTGYMSNGVVRGNVTFRCNKGVDGDSVRDVVYQNNKLVQCRDWGLNLLATYGKPCQRVTIRDNFVEARWVFNFNDAAEDVTVTGNTLVSPGGAYRDAQPVPAVRLTYTNNTELKTNSLPQTEIDGYAARFTAPAPPPPAPPVPPPPALPAIPADAPPASPLADTGKYDLTGNAFGATCREWDSKDVFASPPKFTSVQPPPDDYWDGKSKGTPKGKYGPPDYGMDFHFLWEPDFTGPCEIHGEGQGQVFVQFAGRTVVSGSTVAKDGVASDVFVSVEAGKFYAVWAGFAGTTGDTVCSLRVKVRRPGESERKPLDLLHCFPLKADAPPPVPPTVPPPPPPPVGPLSPPTPPPAGSIFAHPDYPRLLEFARACGGG